MELERTIVIFEISTVKLAKIPRFMQKQRTLNQGLKMLHSGIFGMEFEEKLLPYSKSHP